MFKKSSIAKHHNNLCKSTADIFQSKRKGCLSTYSSVDDRVEGGIRSLSSQTCSAMVDQFMLQNIAAGHCTRKRNEQGRHDTYACVLMLQKFLSRNRNIPTQLQHTSIFTNKVLENCSKLRSLINIDLSNLQENDVLRINRLTFKEFKILSKILREK